MEVTSVDHGCSQGDKQAQWYINFLTQKRLKVTPYVSVCLYFILYI